MIIIGSLVCQLFFKCSDHPDLAGIQFSPAILKLCATRLISAHHPYLIENLILMIARCVNVHGTSILQLLADFGNIDQVSKKLDQKVRAKSFKI